MQPLVLIALQWSTDEVKHCVQFPDVCIVSDVDDGEDARPQLGEDKVEEQEEEGTLAQSQTRLLALCHKRKARDWDNQVGECMMWDGCAECHSFKQSLLSSCLHMIPEMASLLILSFN